MIVLLVVWSIWNAGSVALNTTLYVRDGNPSSLFAAIFCGCMLVLSIAWTIKELR